MTPMEQQFVAVVSSEIFTHREGKPGKTQSLSSNEASKLLGMLIAENRASIEEIVKAAEEGQIPLEETRGLWLAALFRAIAREAMGQGSVLEDYGEIDLGGNGQPHASWCLSWPTTAKLAKVYPTCNCDAAGGRPLSIPRLEGAQP